MEDKKKLVANKGKKERHMKYDISRKKVCALMYVYKCIYVCMRVCMCVSVRVRLCVLERDQNYENQIP